MVGLSRCLDSFLGHAGGAVQGTTAGATLADSRERPDVAAGTGTAPRTGQVEKAPAASLAVQASGVGDCPLFRCVAQVIHHLNPLEGRSRQKPLH